MPVKTLSFNNYETSKQLAIVNKGKFPTSFQIIRTSDSTGGKTPLHWLKFELCKTYNDDHTECKEYPNKPSAGEPFKIASIGVNEMVLVKVSNAGSKPSNLSVYQGELTIRGEKLGEQTVSVGYRATGDGQWRGTMISFGNFNDKNIEKFPASKELSIQTVPNALLRRWINFKRGQMPLQQFRAVLQSIREGSWNLAQVKKDCKDKLGQGSEDVICYPYLSSTGYEVLAFSNREAPVPSGISELNFAINVKEQKGNLLQGRIDTSQTLQYPGNPQITIAFDEKPGSKKLQPLKSFNAQIDIGGRYYVGDKTGCLEPKDFQKVTIPWLIPGFEAGTWPAQKGLFREFFECRTHSFPRKGKNAEEQKLAERLNMSLSSSNPIPNGWGLRRKIELVDGALIDNRYLFVIYRERFVSFFSTANSKGNNPLSKDFVNYGYIFMERAQADLEDADFAGSAPAAAQACGAQPCPNGQVCVGGSCRIASQLKQVGCSPDVIQKATGRTVASQDALKTWSRADLAGLVNTLISGQSSSVSGTADNLVKPDSTGNYVYTKGSQKIYIHYLCEDTGLFNGGPTTDGEACPVGSKVTFFEVPGLTNAAIRSEPCQAAKICSKRLEQLKSRPGFRADVPYRCEKPNEALCSTQRKDLRAGKWFFKGVAKSGYVSPYNSLQASLAQAFRYRIKFVSRSGKNIGFTPSICQGGSQLIPYCYSPKVIEAIESRVNCLEKLYTTTELFDKLDANQKNVLKNFLVHNFSYTNTKDSNGTIQTNFGFEALNAELKIMLGDDAYTKSFSSRYDLAGSRLISFQGDAFEPNGIQLSGALGFEMHNLYLSIQYYQMVLDRFFSQSSVIFYSFQSNTASFITLQSVTSYFQKLLLASTRKARAWGQIAKRYHNLNRPDLARHVVERAYAATYMELTILTRLLREMALKLDSKQIDQVRQEVKRVVLTYKAALLDMEDIYKKLTVEMNFLGLPPGFIPFPALDFFSAKTATTNAFTVALAFAKEKLAIGRDKEMLALQTKRTFDTDAASFQSELVRIQQNYESQLLEICGPIQSGSRVVPAITKYAYLTPKTLRMGNPCGRVQGGQIYDAFIQLEKVRLSFESMQVAHKNVAKQVELEKLRIQRYCKKKFELAEFAWKVRGKQNNLQREMLEAQRQIERLMRITQDLSTMSELSKCFVIAGTAGGSNCPSGILKAVAFGVFVAGREVAIEYLSKAANAKRLEISKLEQELEQRQLKIECDPKDGTARIESQIKLQELRNSMLNFTLEALRAEYDIRLAVSNIVRLQQRAKRLMAEQAENEQMSINIQAARNDPNVRIYKNDAIITAERTFEEAMHAAYRATLVYEYYTGQSYKYKGDLYLIRLISAGDRNLEAYLSKLEQAFREFEEQNGKPDIRVAIFSLRDDILKVARSREDGTPRTLSERVQEFQQQLSSRERLNSEGYIAFPFSLSVLKGDSKVSPVTVNHKILYLEAEIIGGDLGDAVGRLYLRQKGTGVVRLFKNELKFYTLPARTAVINTFSNGSKVFSPDIYQNFRLRDRPLGNTHWELLLNQVTEKANQDINLSSINDIKIYFYYTDFTEED